MCSGVQRLKGGVAHLVSAVKGAGSFLSPFVHTLKVDLTPEVSCGDSNSRAEDRLLTSSLPCTTALLSSQTGGMSVFSPKPVWVILLNISKVSALSY